MKGRIYIEQGRCKGCGLCIDACPMKLIIMTGLFNKAGYFIVANEQDEKCTGCAKCAAMCPEIAISVYK